MRSGDQLNCEETELGNFKTSLPKFKVSRLIVRKRVSKKKPMLQTACVLCHFHNNHGSVASQQSLISSPPHHAVFLQLIPLLIGLLQLDYQNKIVSPFDTHPINIWIFFAAASIYGFGLVIYMEENHRANYSTIISRVILSSGALASVSLGSVFLQRLIGFFCLILWIILPVMLGRHLIKHIYQWLKHTTVKVISQTSDRFHMFWGWFKLKNQHLPK